MCVRYSTVSLCLKFACLSFFIGDVASVEYEILLSPENRIDWTAFDDLTEVDVKMVKPIGVVKHIIRLQRDKKIS